MPRLPNPGSDHDQWGYLLNEFLQVSHRDDGALKSVINVTNVKDFGAVGNGVVDDTDAIVAAIAGANGIIFFPAGDYVINGSVQISLDDLTLLGAGAKLTQTADSTPLFVFTGCQQISVNGLHLIGVGTDFDPLMSTAGRGIEFRGCGGIIVRDCRFENFGSGGITLEDSGNVRILHCDIEGTGESIGNITPNDNNQFGIHTLTEANFGYLHIQGCHISQTCQGIFSSGGWTESIITDNHIHNIPGQSGIYLANPRQVTCSHNSLRNCNQAGAKFQITKNSPHYNDNFSVVGNTIEATKQPGLLFIDADMDAKHQFRNVAITGNTLIGCASGINCRRCFGLNK